MTPTQGGEEGEGEGEAGGNENITPFSFFFFFFSGWILRSVAAFNSKHLLQIIVHYQGSPDVSK